MARHYLNRTDEVTPDDEWSYISEIGSKVEFKDVMDVEQRYITFGKQLQRKVHGKKKPLDATKEGIRWALDAAGNTGQYIKFVNMTIDKRQTEIDKIKNLQKKFDNEVSMLSSHKLEKLHLDKGALANLDINSIHDYLNQLLLEKRLTKSNLENLKGDLSSMANELRHQEEEIEEVREHIKARSIQDQNTKKPIDVNEAIVTIQRELTEISQKYDVSKLSEAFDSLMASKQAQNRL